MLQLTTITAVPVPVLGAALLLAYVAYTLFNNLYLSPLASLPGPRLWGTTQLFYTNLLLSGSGHKRLLELHKKYGPVIRVAPAQVAIAGPTVWKDVHGHRKGGGLENGKDPIFYKMQGTGMIGAVSAPEHGRQRRILAHAFSAKSMAEQQPLIRGYMDTLIAGLKKESLRNNDGGGGGGDSGIAPVDAVKWFNLTTFDVIGDLAFGESFGCLKGADYHPWVAIIFPALRAGLKLLEIQRYIPNLDSWLRRTPMWKMLMRTRVERDALTKAKVSQRIELKTHRPDFMHHMLGRDADGNEKLTFQEIVINANTLIVAGSETTATSLSGITYLLGTHPEVLAKLTKEVRGTFSSESEIDLISVQHLKYMLAVLDEGMRLFPAVPGSLPRIIHEGGAVVCDYFLPEGTVVNNWQWAIYRNPANFTLPESFIPERFLGDPRFANDRWEAFKPFSFGPRDCIGKNLAYAEMRSILARIIWNFDLKLAEPDKDWINGNRVFALWDKDPLYVYLYPRVFE